MKQNIFSRFFGSTNKTDNSLDLSAVQQDLIGWHESNRVDTLRHYYNNQYENGYASINAIVNQFFQVVPYAVDANGKRLKQSNLTDVLARPNVDMSGTKFREALGVFTLVHDKVYIRVWHKGNRLTENSLSGLTLLEGVTEVGEGPEKTYNTSAGGTYTADEVIVLKNINPYCLEDGYSVANAGSRWANLNDYIAAYQTGFFKNGAIPAGQFLIAAQGSEFDDIVRNMKRKHQGADKNNNIIYNSTPVDPSTGKPGASQIQWVPFNSQNKDLALKDIFDQATQMVDSVYGVPASMRGYNDNNTYASVRVDQQIFIDNTIRPFATKIWDQFVHQLNNLTGGLGYYLEFDLDVPHIAEEDKAFAEAQSANVGALKTLLDMGATLDSAIQALELDDSFKFLKIEEKAAPVETPVEDVPQVDTGDEVADTPDPEEQKNKLDPLSVSCQHCGRYLFKATGTTVVEDMPCPKCKAHNNFKIINPKGDDITHTFTYKETAPTEMKHVIFHNSLKPEQIALITDKIESTIRHQMEDQINAVDIKTVNSVDKVTNAVGDQDAEKVKLYAEEILVTIKPVIANEGMKQYLLARTIDGISGEDLNTFVLDDKQMNKYRTYLQGVVKGYAEDTAQSIRKSLETSIGNQLPIHEVQKNLQGVMNTDEYRVKRLALTETNRAGNAGSIYAMEKVQQDTGLKVEKVWQTRDGACEYCKSVNGTTVGISDNFVNKGDTITGVDGGELVNNFGHMDVPTAHPNCGCYTTYKVVKD